MNKPTRGRIHKGVVSIVGTTNLKPGDEVVVVQPLRVPVLSSRTGRFLGMDEKVLGRGKVTQAGDALIVQIEHINKLKQELKPTVKGVVRVGVKGHQGNEVLVKLANGRMK